MMKKVFFMIMSLILMIGLVACEGKSENKTYTFKGKVVEMYMNNLIVEPLENENIRKSSDKIQVWIGQTPEFHPPIFPEGTLVEIEYDGNIAETYPAQINAINLRTITEEGEDIIPPISENEMNHSDEAEEQEIIGKWNTVSAVNSDSGEETKNIVDIFGSSYREYGSYLEFMEDGTFVDAIQPITDGSRSNTGSYIIKNDYYELGDCYVFLTYSDGNEEILQKVFLDDSNTPYLVLENFINGYQLFLKNERN